MAAWAEQDNGSEAEAFATFEVGSDPGRVSCTPSTPEQWHDCRHDLPQAQVQLLMCQMSAMQLQLQATQEQLQSSQLQSLAHEREIEEQRRQISSLLTKQEPVAKKKMKLGRRERQQAKLEKQAESSSESVIHEEHEEESAPDTPQPLLENQGPANEAAVGPEEAGAIPSAETSLVGEAAVDAEEAGPPGAESEVSLSSSLQAVKTAVGHECRPLVLRMRAFAAVCVSSLLSAAHATSTWCESLHSRYATQCVQNFKTVAGDFLAGARKMAFGCAWLLEVSCTSMALQMLACGRACGRARNGSGHMEESIAPESKPHSEARDPFLERTGALV